MFKLIETFVEYCDDMLAEYHDEILIIGLSALVMVFVVLSD